MKKLAPFLFLVFVGLVSLGCGRSSVEAIPRQSKFKPEFVSESKTKESASETVAAKNNLDVAFFHDDLVACVQIAVGRVLSHPDFKDVPWDSVEEQLASLLGEDNSQLNSIDQFWVLLDRDSFDMGGSSSTTSPAVLVLEYASPFNDEQLIEAIETRESDAEGNLQFVPERLTDRRIAIGTPKLVKKLRKGDGQQTEIAKKFAQLELEPEVNGIFMFAPIRGVLQSFASMASAFSKESQALSSLPEVLDHLEFQVAASGEELIMARVFHSDPELAGELTKLLQSNLAGGNSANGSMLEALSGSQEKMMVPVRSTEVFAAVGKDISERDLISVASEDGFVALNLRRPEKINELVTAVVEDGRRQAVLMERINQFNEIAVALKEYDDRYGCLPSSESLVDHPDELPNQFSWRVALLPMLGEQVLYDKFDFDEPWDSPGNLKTAEEIPEVFRDRFGEESNPRTRIHITSGQDGLYRDDRTIPKIEDVTDKRIWTAVVIEGGEETAEIWTKPAALAMDSLSTSNVGQPEENGILMISAGFKTRILEKTPENLLKVLTVEGGESMSRQDFLNSGMIQR